MVSGTNNKRIKVVWLCHFSNPDICNKLGINKIQEFAPWISRLAEIFENKNEVDVFIVSPFTNIYKKEYFKSKNINYIFVPYSIPYVPKKIIGFIHNISEFYYLRILIKKTIKKINPDLIHLFGTENAYFTSSIFEFKNKLPVFITIQGFISHSASASKQIDHRKKIEKEIIKRFNNYGVRDEEMKSFIKEINPEAIFYHHELAPYIPKFIKNYEDNNIYDIIFFARVSKDKGIEDLIQALSIIKLQKKDVKLCVIGSATPEYLEELYKLSIELKVRGNIDFKGLLDSIDEVHSIAVQSGICVIPTYYDTIPGTIAESMLMKIPCVSYAVGGIPSLNQKEETIKLVQKGDIEGLAKGILFLFNNPESAKNMAKKAFENIENLYSETIIHNSIKEAYIRIIGKNE